MHGEGRGATQFEPEREEGRRNPNLSVSEGRRNPNLSVSKGRAPHNSQFTIHNSQFIIHASPPSTASSFSSPCCSPSRSVCTAWARSPSGTTKP
jgi:hypothetical protein